MKTLENDVSESLMIAIVQSRGGLDLLDCFPLCRHDAHST